MAKNKENGRDELGDRMKFYEKQSASRLMPLLPAFARLDGRSFSTFTRGLDKPYDKRLSDLMISATKFLVEETNANLGYTQSDEITLTWLPESFESEIFFAGKISKMVSILASACSVYFNQNAGEYFPREFLLKKSTPLFDCRVWSVPNKAEAANVFLWRELDAIRNSIQSAGQAEFSHKRLQSTGHERIKMMLEETGINWENYPTFFKRGTYVQKRSVVRPFTAVEMDKLPLKHKARENPGLSIERKETRILDMPKFLDVENKEEVIFEGSDPICKRS